METKCSNDRSTNPYSTGRHLSFSPVPELFFTDQFFNRAIIKLDRSWRNSVMCRFIHSCHCNIYWQDSFLAYLDHEFLYRTNRDPAIFFMGWTSNLNSSNNIVVWSSCGAW